MLTNNHMQSWRRLDVTRFLAAPLAFAFLSCAAVAAPSDKQAEIDPKKLRICAAANELPFSHRDGTGFENKIAAAVAEAMSKEAQFVWLDKASIYIVRDQLDKRLCDVVMGVDTGDQRVLTTQPYYRTGYVFIQKKDSPLKLDSWSSSDISKVHRIGFVAGTPAETMIRKVGLYEDNFNYMASLLGFKGKRNQYLRVPPEKMVGDVASGESDVAVHFAPEVARYVIANDKLKMTLIPDDNIREDGERVPHQFDQSVAVRLGEKELLAAVDLALDKAKPAIAKILADEGIPLVPVSSKGSGRGASIDAILGPEFE